MTDTFNKLREEFGDMDWILSCENSWNEAYAPEPLQNRVILIIKEEKSSGVKDWKRPGNIRSKKSIIIQFAESQNWSQEQLDSWAHNVLNLTNGN